MSPGATFHIVLKQDGQLFPLVDDFSTLSPFSTGGDSLVIKERLPLTEAHYSQTDTSMNSKIWDLIPIMEQRELESLHTMFEMFRLVHQTKDGVYDRRVVKNKMKDHLFNHELIRLHCLKCIDNILHSFWYAHTPISFTTWGGLENRKPKGQIEPLQAVLKRADAMKAEGNSYSEEKYGKALKTYRDALYALYPWSNSPLLFTAVEAFKCGIAQLESTLWNNLATTILKLTDVHGRNFHLFTAACRSAQVAMDMRFITHRQLAKAYARSAEAMLGVQQSQPSKLELDGVPIKMRLTLDAATDINMKPNTVYSVMVSLADPDNGSWAHANCHDRHDGCISLAVAQKRIDAAREKGKSSLALPSGIHVVIEVPPA